MSSFPTPAREHQMAVLQKGLLAEEKAVDFYKRYKDGDRIWDMLPPETAQKIKNNLDILARESAGHIPLVENIISEFEKLK